MPLDARAHTLAPSMLSGKKPSGQFAKSDMTRSQSSQAVAGKKPRRTSKEPTVTPDSRALIEQTAVRRNQSQICDAVNALQALITMAEEEDQRSPIGSRQVLEMVPTADLPTVTTVGLVNSEGGSYATSVARSEGSLSLGPALHHRQVDKRIAECVALLYKLCPEANEDINFVGTALLNANPAEGLETIYQRQLRLSTDIYAGVRDLCGQMGHIVGRISDFQSSGRTGDNTRKNTEITNFTPLLRKTIREVRDAIASQAVLGSASLDLCLELRRSIENLEQENRGLQYAKVVLSRQLREAFLDGVVTRSELHEKFLTNREAESQANFRLSATLKKVAHPKVLVMCQVENTYARKLHRPRLFSEALMEVLHWMDLKLPTMQGRRVNFNSALEPKDVYDVRKNPVLPPESFFIEFPTIGPAVEFCISLQQDMALSVDWPHTLLRIPCFEEVKDGLKVECRGGEDESAVQRSRRVANQRPVWRGLRIRAAIHVGLPYVTHPFKGASPMYGLPNAAQRPETEITPDDVPHLLGMAVDVTMQLLRKARGGEVLMSAKAAEAYDALKFQHPDSFANVSKIPRSYSLVKGAPGKDDPNIQNLSRRTSEGDEEGARQGSTTSMSAIPRPEGRRNSDNAYSGQMYVLPGDRVFALVSDMLKSREELSHPYHYHDVSEAVFPPATWWRSTDAQSSNLSLFASIGGKVEDMPSDMEDLTDEDDEYIPPEVVEDSAPASEGVGGASISHRSEGRNLSVSLDSKSVLNPTSAGKPPKKKRRTTAEYEAELERLNAQIEALNARFQQQESIKSMFSEEIQLLQTKNQSLNENLNIKKKELAKSQKRYKTCAALLRHASVSVMTAEDQLAHFVCANSQLRMEIKSLQQEVDEKDTCLSVTLSKQRDSIQKSAFRLSRQVNGECQTDPDPRLPLEVSRGDTLESALRWALSLLAVATQHVEMVTHPSSTATATGTFSYKRSLVTSDVHRKITSFLEDPAVAAAVATIDDRFEPLGSMKLVTDKSRTKSNRVDDLIRTVRKFHSDQVALEKDRPVDPYSGPQSPRYMSRKSASGNDYDVYDWSGPLKGLSIFETLRHAAGHVLKTVNDVMSLDQLLQVRYEKVQKALVSAVQSKDDAFVPDVSLVVAQHLQGAESSELESEGSTAVTPVADMGFAAQRAREAEGKVKDQSDVILQYRAELAKAGREMEDARAAQEVEQLRVEVLSGKLTEVNGVLNNLRDSVLAAIHKMTKEIPNASLLKTRIMAVGKESASMSLSSSFNAADGDAHVEFLLTKVLTDLQVTLQSTVADFCTATSNSKRNNSSVVGVDPVQQVGDDGDDSVSDLSVASNSAVSSPAQPRLSVSSAQSKRGDRTSISNVVTHDLELANIMLRSQNLTSDAATNLPDGIPALKTLSPTELLEKDRKRLLLIQKQFDGRLGRLREKEQARIERDAQLLNADWNSVIEKQYKREKYLVDQIRLLLKRRAADEQSSKESARNKLDRSCQTSLLGNHRMFVRHDDAVARGVDEDEEAFRVAAARRDEEFQGLLATMRKVEREQQTDMSCFGRRSCKTQTRRKGTDFVDDEGDEDYLISVESEYSVSSESFGGSSLFSPRTQAEMAFAAKTERKRGSVARSKLRNLKKGKLMEDGGGPVKLQRSTQSVAVMTSPRLSVVVKASTRTNTAGVGAATRQPPQATSSHSINNPVPLPVRIATQSKMHNVNLLSSVEGSLADSGRSRKVDDPSLASSGPLSKQPSTNLISKRVSQGSIMASVVSAKVVARKLSKKMGAKSLSKGSMSSATTKQLTSAAASSQSILAPPLPDALNLLEIDSDDDSNASPLLTAHLRQSAEADSQLVFTDSNAINPPLNDGSSSIQDRDTVLFHSESAASLLLGPNRPASSSVMIPLVPKVQDPVTVQTVQEGGPLALPELPTNIASRSNTGLMRSSSSTASGRRGAAESGGSLADVANESAEMTSMRQHSGLVVRTVTNQSQAMRAPDSEFSSTAQLGRGGDDSIEISRVEVAEMLDTFSTPNENTANLSLASPALPDAFAADSNIRINRAGSASNRPRTPLKVVTEKQHFGDSLSRAIADVDSVEYGAFAALQETLLKPVEDPSATPPAKSQRNRLMGKVITPDAHSRRVEGKVSAMVPFLLEPPKELEGQYTMHTQQFDLSHLGSYASNGKSAVYNKLLDEIATDADLRKEMEGVQKGVVARRLYENRPSTSSTLDSTVLGRSVQGLEPSSSYFRHTARRASSSAASSKRPPRPASVASLDHTKLTPKDQRLFQHPAVPNADFANRHKEFSDENYVLKDDRIGSPTLTPTASHLQSSLRPVTGSGGLPLLSPNEHGRLMSQVMPQKVNGRANESVLVPVGRGSLRPSTSQSSIASFHEGSAATSSLLPPTTPQSTKLTPIPKESLQERLTSAPLRDPRSYSVVLRKADLSVGTSL